MVGGGKQKGPSFSGFLLRILSVNALCGSESLNWISFPVLVVPWQLFLDVIARVLGMPVGDPAFAPVARRFCLVIGGLSLLLFW